MATRFYSSTAIQTTLTASVGPSNTSIQVAATTGFPGSTPFTLSLDYGSASEELVDVTAVMGFSLTVTRNVDGTPASSHNAGAVVRHVTSARDFTEFQTHINTSTNVHGLAVGSAVVGTTDTQTLTNKTLTKAHGSLENVDLYNTGAGNVTSVIGDSANPTASRMNWLKDEISLTPLATLNSSGGMILAKSTTDADNIYKVRVVEDVGGVDRAALLAGGTLTLAPTTTTTFVPVDVIAPDISSTKRAIRLAASGGGTERFTVWNDGHVDIVGNSAATPVLDVTAPVTPSASTFRVLDSTGVARFSVSNAGRALASDGVDAGNSHGAASINPLRVLANTTSQTGDLQQWIDSTGATVARVAPDGEFFPNFSTSSGTSVATANGGWTMSSAIGVIRGGIATIALGFARAGADIVVGAAGNISPDITMGTLNSTYLPLSAFTQAMGASGTDGVGAGGVRLVPTTGNVDLLSWTPNATIVTGNIIRVTLTHPV